MKRTEQLNGRLKSCVGQNFKLIQPPPLSVVHVLLGTANGGGELSFCRFLQNALMNDNITVLASARDSSMLNRACREENINYVVEPEIKNSFKRFYWKYRFLKKGKYDVIHVHTYYKGIFWILISFLAGTKERVFHSHSANKRFLEKRYGNILANFLYSTIDLTLTVFGTRFFFVSDGSRREFPIFNLLRESKLHPPFLALNDKKKFKILAERTYDICFVGRLSFHRIFGDTKGLKVFFATVFKCLEINDSLKIAIYGEGEALLWCVRTIESSQFKNNFHFFEFVEDINTALEDTKVLVAPSMFEGFGLSVLEAQIAGTMVVCSDAFPEEVILSSSTKVIAITEPVEKWVDACFEQLSVQTLPALKPPESCDPKKNPFSYNIL